VETHQLTGTKQVTLALTRLADVDLSGVQHKVSRLGWSKSLIERVETEYLRFLALAGSGTMTVTPPPMIDEYWHAHILHTRQYASDCDYVFGRFVHHAPLAGADAGSEGVTDSSAQTLSVYRRVFGEPDPYIWDIMAQDCNSPSECYGGGGGGGGCLGGPTGDD